MIPKRWKIVGWVTFGLVIVICISLGVLYGTPLGHSVLYPSKKVPTPICVLNTPSGWMIRPVEKYNIESGGRFISLTHWLFSHARDFSVEDKVAIIAMRYYSQELDEFDFITTPLGEFLSDSNAVRTTKNIAGREIIFYRYEGPMFLDHVENKKYVKGNNSKLNSVTIGFYSDFGFGGTFWGLPEQEKDFWKVINSIEWKI